MKILLLGSPSIAVPAFEQVINNFEVVGIVTQPDKPKGRGMLIQETEVAKLGKEYGIKIFKPNKIGEIYDELKKLEFDLILSFAFGQWIPDKILKLGKHKPLNIHGSLLPKYRGAAPVHYAILNGDNEIGITLMEMIKEMDAGDMYFKASTSINSETSTGEAFEIISDLAATNIVSWLNKLSNVKPQNQGAIFSLSPKIEKSFGELKLDMNIKDAFRKIKGLNPFPGAFIFIDEKRVKIFNASYKNIINSVEVKFSDGSLYLTDYQFESRKRKTL